MHRNDPKDSTKKQSDKQASKQRHPLRPFLSFDQPTEVIHREELKNLKEFFLLPPDGVPPPPSLLWIWTRHMGKACRFSLPLPRAEQMELNLHFLIAQARGKGK